VIEVIGSMLKKRLLILCKVPCWSSHITKASEATRLDMVWPKMVEIDLQFDALVASHDEYAPLIKTCLALRMHKTEDLGRLFLAFSPTPSGL
jgi:hypothetical protein